MTAYQVMPGLTADEYAELRADIAAHGVRVPIDVDENGQVLDGHHRSIIASELQVECPRRVLAGLSEAEKVAHALAVNVHRRNLTREQRRELLAASIKADPQASDREHARRVGADHKTAASVRADVEARGEIPHVSERTDSAGRQQPATKPARVTQTTRTTEATKVEHDVDLATGEVLPPADAEPFDYDEPSEPEPAKPRYEPEPLAASAEAKAKRDRLVSNQAWSNNLAANVNWFARLAPAAYRAREFRDQFIPEYAAAHGGVTRGQLLDAARFITALADVWAEDLKESA